MSTPTYGGQAVIEGVMMRGGSAMAVAVRRPDGTIAARAERLGGLLNSPLRRVPLLRGVLVLFETLGLGMRALTWSAAVASNQVDERGEARRLTLLDWLVLLGAFAVGVTVFFVGPVAATAWLDRRLPAPWMALALEGLLRVALLLGYIWVMGRASDIRRVFQYHGAEHMTIYAQEDGRELNVPAIRRYPKEHPRCGTSFLLTVALVAMVVFAFAGTEPLWWRFASRLVLVPVVAAVSYEAIRFAGFHQGWPVVRWLFAGNLALQRLTTRPPDDEQIQVAIAALQRVRDEERTLAR
ncbi:MAG: DUF1385 domain-containing protein [Dehalococcoidia bacterium]